MLNDRLNNLERQIQGRPCAACAAAPRCVLIDASPNAREKFDRQMREREQRCTCGHPFYRKIVAIVREQAVAA